MVVVFTQSCTGMQSQVEYSTGGKISGLGQHGFPSGSVPVGRQDDGGKLMLIGLTVGAPNIGKGLGFEGKGGNT